MVGLTQALEGMRSSEAQFDQAATRIARASLPTGAQADQVDLSAAAVALLESRNSFDANTKVAKVADEMEQKLLEAVG